MYIVEKCVEHSVACLRNTCKGHYVKPDSGKRVNILILSPLYMLTCPRKIFSHQPCQYKENIKVILSWNYENWHCSVLLVFLYFWSCMESTSFLVSYVKMNAILKYRNNIGVYTNTLHAIFCRVVEYSEKIICTTESIHYCYIKLNRNVIK